MTIKKIIKLFEDGSVFVTGLRGTGKDMLTGNCIIRRNKPYISNVDYGGQFIPIDFKKLDCNNDYKSFLDNNITPYIYPYDDGIDIYVSDSGVYFPCQYNEKLNKEYGTLSSSIALSRHLGLSNWHFNSQSLGRVWDKFREQSETYIRCNKCKVIFGWVFQVITIYDKYDSCLNNVPPFPIKRPIINQTLLQSYNIAKMNYTVTYGTVKRKLLVYRNKSSYDTRVFKTKLMEG